MWEPSKCCCFQLRTGSIIIGLLFLIGGSFSLIGGIRTLVEGNEESKQYCKNEDAFGPFDECVETFNNIVIGVTSTSMVIAIFHIMFSILLLYGILKQKTAFFIPLMIVYAVEIGFLLLVIVSSIAVLFYFYIPFGIIVVFAAIFGGFAFLEIYFLLVIRAHYYQIKRTKGNIHMSLKNENTETPPPYPGPQAPPFPTNECVGYPGSDAPLYPALGKDFK